MMILFRKYYFLWILLMILITGCNTPRVITIEIPKKGENELPEQIQSLLLVNRTVDDSYSDLPSDSLQNIFFRQGFNLDTTIYDLQAADTMLHALGDLLFESGRYDYVIPENRFIDHEKNAFMSEAMNWDEVKDLCHQFQTDAVLSVDLFKTRVITKYDKDTYFNPIDNSFYEAVAAHMAVVYEALFRVYDPENERIPVREFLRDTLYWEDTGGSASELFENFTPVKQAITEASIALALDLSEKISTTWQREQRPLLSDKTEEMQQAEKLASSGDWKSAMTIWEKVAAENKSKSTRSMAMLNLAVGYEIQGDLEKAVYWGLESYNTQFRQLTYDYLNRLKYRKLELEKEKK
jgi:hypothetical protein